jgi:GH15 family glucan-1,4-alpha-glucosidase
MLHCGFEEDARAWLQWLSRSIQGDPKTLKVVYGITGKREHSEWQASWLSGYRGSHPVLIGNKASDQLQLDVFGEVMDALFRARQHGLYPLDDQSGEGLELPLLKHLEDVWTQPDKGMWEMRSAAQHFTESKVMAWVAFDRGIRMVEQFGLQGPVERWRNIRAKIHNDICSKGFRRGLNSFTQAYSNKHMDASLLMLPLVGFLPIDDPRIEGTIALIEKRLLRDGLLLRYDTSHVKDGLPPGEGSFLACNFWLVDIYVLQGRRRQAEKHFERLLGLSNDVGLLSEEFDRKHRLIGNFPQAFSHIGLLHAALALKLGTSVRLQGLDGAKADNPPETESRRKSAECGMCIL